MRLFLFGGAGVGKTTLARLIANRLSAPCFDLDDFFHVPTDPPYQKSRSPEARVALANELFLPRADWVLSGNLRSWSLPVAEAADHAVLLVLKPEARLARLRVRETARFGDRIAPGGDMHDTHLAFMDRAMHYDDPQVPEASRAAHEALLAQLPGQGHIVNADAAPEALVDAVLAACR
ncbi:MAG: hypothetical protein CSA72_06805 [Rhodobacterales bacterium]|nr:MAG: hypothetical protein CSA72_06805 [Rhodobacterales bacterium]